MSTLSNILEIALRDLGYEDEEVKAIMTKRIMIKPKQKRVTEKDLMSRMDIDMRIN